jgi:Tol biopolymer transport system component
VNLGCTVNSKGAEWSPYLLRAQGKTYLFFSSDGFGGEGGQDIFMSRKGANGFEAPIAQSQVNTSFNDVRPNLRKDGLEIVFDSDRPGGVGATDVYSSTRATLHSRWDEAWPVTQGGVNSKAGESRASLSADGTTLYFGSSRNGGQSDIFSATRTKLADAG